MDSVSELGGAGGRSACREAVIEVTNLLILENYLRSIKDVTKLKSPTKKKIITVK